MKNEIQRGRIVRRFEVLSMRKVLHSLMVSLLIVCSGPQAQNAASSAEIEAVGGTLRSLGPTASAGQSATQLSDGRWLLIGGSQTPAQMHLVDSTGQSAVLPIHLNQPRSDHSATLLPDGMVMIFGGRTSAGEVIDTAELYDPAAASLSQLGSIGLLPRAEHTATVLSDGRVLIAGGIGANHLPLLDAELYNPHSRQTERFNARLDTARLNQLAALLPDGPGSVLLWGGTNGRGKTRVDGDLYDPVAGEFSSVTAARAQSLSHPLATSDAPTVLESQPAAHAAAVPVGQILQVRFNKRMAVPSLNTDTVILIGPNGTTAIKPIAVENGVLLFVTPMQDLMPASNYTLFVQGATDEAGHPLPFTAIGFSTVALGISAQGPAGSASSASGSSTGSTSTGSTKGGGLAPFVGSTTNTANILANLSSILAPFAATGADPRDQISNPPIDDTELWSPDAHNYRGDWTSGRRHLGEQTPPTRGATKRALYGNPDIAQLIANLKPADVAKVLPKMRAAAARQRSAEAGVTAVSGQALKLNGRPLAGVTLSIGGRAIRTDTNGEFLLSGVPSGHQILVIDGSGAGQGGRQYGRYEYGMTVVAGKTNALPFVIWMTRLDAAGSANIVSPTATPMVLTNPKIPGLELHIPAGTVIRDANGKIVTQLNLTAIPTDQPPFPIPAVPVPTYFTVQPGGAHLEGANGQVSQGAQLIYPNFSHSLPGTRISFWNYDAVTKGWYVYGQGTVTSDGTQVMPDPGVVIYEFSGAMVSLPTNGPDDGPCVDCQPEPGLGDSPDNPEGYVDPSTGLLDDSEVDMTIPDTIPIQVARSYRQKDNASRGFGIGTNLSYDFFNVGNSVDTTSNYDFQDLVLPNGSRVHYPRISPGTTYGDAIYQNTTAPGVFYGSIINGGAAPWVLTLKDGVKYSFRDSTGSANPRKPAVFSISDRNGNTVTLTRDGAYNLTRVTSPNGRHLNFVYDSSNRVTQASDDTGRVIRYSYDAAGRLTTVTDPAGNAKRYTYDSNNNMLSVADARGNTVVTNTYDGNNRVIGQTFGDGSTKSYDYTLDGTGTYVTQTVVTDQLGNQTQLSFNSSHFSTGQTIALGSPSAQTATFGRGTNSNLVNSITDALGRTTTFTCDGLGNILSVTRADGSSISIAYDQTYSLPTQITDPNGHATKYSYDGHGNLLTVTDPLNHVTTFTYDSQGRLLTERDPLGHTTSLGYSGPDNSSITDALGRTIIINRDALGRIVSTVDPLGNRILRSYDGMGRLESITDPSGAKTQFGYDADSNLVSVIDPTQHTINYGFDILNRRTSRTDALTNVETWAYDGLGETIRHTDRKGQATQYGYDVLGRLSLVTYADGSTVGITSDAGDRLTQIVDSVSGTISRSYDLQDRVTQEQSAVGTVHYGYDTGGRRTSFQISSGPTTSYSYDAGNRLLAIARGTETVSFSYDDANRRTTLTLPNGVATQYAYDDANELTGLSYTNSSGPLGDLAYTYDAAGRRSSVSGNWASGQIPAATTSDYQYDGGNRLISRNGAVPTYGGDGAMQSDGQGNSYTWDVRGRLAQITQGTSVVAAFGYDSFGRRVTKTIGSNSITYLYDGLNPVQEQGSISSTSLTGLGIDERYARDDVGGRTYYLADSVNSTVALTDAGGGVLQQYQYDSYGNVTPTNSSLSLTNPYQYTGRENDQTGLYYYRARYYSPAMQRFISEDPLGLGGGTNVYAYVGGNPLNFTDSSGEQAEAIPVGIGIGIIGICYLTNSCQNLAKALTDSVNDLSKTNNRCKCNQANEPNIRAALATSPLQTYQKSVSVPVIQIYVDMIEGGSTAPPITMNGNIILDGNHRYIAALLCNKSPLMQPGTPPLFPPSPIPIQQISLDPFDWGHR